MADMVRFRLSEDDMVHAARLFSLMSLRKPRTAISLAIIFVGCVVLMGSISGVFFPLDFDRLAEVWPFVVGASLLPFFLVFLLAVVVNPRLARRTYRQQRSLHGEIGLNWTEEQLEFDSEYGKFAMPWSHFVRWGEDKHVFLLFESNRLYRIIPKRVLDAENERSLRRGLASIGA